MIKDVGHVGLDVDKVGRLFGAQALLVDLAGASRIESVDHHRFGTLDLAATEWTRAAAV